MLIIGQSTRSFNAKMLSTKLSYVGSFDLLVYTFYSN